MKMIIPSAVAALALVIGPQANAMIRHIFITEPPVNNEQFDPWYASVHD